MFPKVNPLPRAKVQASVCHRHTESGGGQHRAHVSGHVVFSLIHVSKKRVTVRHETREKRIQIASHLRIRVLVNYEGRARVMDEDLTETIDHRRCLHRAADLGRDLIASSTLGGDDEAVA